MADEVKKTADLEGDELQDRRIDGKFVCPVCGPTTVAPVDIPVINDIDGSNQSPPHCVTCGTAIQPHLQLVHIYANRFNGQVDHLMHQASNYGVIELGKDTFSTLMEDDKNAR